MKKLEIKSNLLTKNDVNKISKDAFYDNHEFKIIKAEFKRLAKI